MGLTANSFRVRANLHAKANDGRHDCDRARDLRDERPIFQRRSLNLHERKLPALFFSRHKGNLYRARDSVHSGSGLFQSECVQFGTTEISNALSIRVPKPHLFSKAPVKRVRKSDPDALSEKILPRRRKHMRYLGGVEISHFKCIPPGRHAAFRPAEGTLC